MRAKQTGPAWAVKALAGALPLLTAALLLTACAGGWVNPNKTPAEMKADEAACNTQAEEDTLARSGRARADYGAPPGGPTAGSFGRSPMEMHDRDAATQDFRSGFDVCMESKGYTRGKPAQP